MSVSCLYLPWNKSDIITYTLHRHEPEVRDQVTVFSVGKTYMLNLVDDLVILLGDWYRDQEDVCPFDTTTFVAASHYLQISGPCKL